MGKKTQTLIEALKEVDPNEMVYIGSKGGCGFIIIETAEKVFKELDKIDKSIKHNVQSLLQSTQNRIATNPEKIAATKASIKKVEKTPILVLDRKIISKKNLEDISKTINNLSKELKSENLGETFFQKEKQLKSLEERSAILAKVIEDSDRLLACYDINELPKPVFIVDGEKIKSINDFREEMDKNRKDISALDSRKEKLTRDKNDRVKEKNKRISQLNREHKNLSKTKNASAAEIKEIKDKIDSINKEYDLHILSIISQINEIDADIKNIRNINKDILDIMSVGQEQIDRIKSLNSAISRLNSELEKSKKQESNLIKRLDTWKEFKFREVVEVYPHTVDIPGTTLLIKGKESGGFWSYDEQYRSK